MRFIPTLLFSLALVSRVVDSAPVPDLGALTSSSNNNNSQSASPLTEVEKIGIGLGAAGGAAAVTAGGLLLAWYRKGRNSMKLGRPSIGPKEGTVYYDRR